MLSIFIVAESDTPQAQFLFGSTPLREGLLDHTINSVQRVFPGQDISGVTDDHDLAAFFQRRGINDLVFPGLSCGLPYGLDRLSDKLRESVPNAAQRSWKTLFISPARGPVTIARLKVFKQWLDTAKGLSAAVSASLLDENCHPGWLKVIPRQDVKNGGVMIKDFRQSLAFKPEVPDEFQHYFPGKDKILGSQWLSPLFHVDGSITAAGSAVFGTGLPEREFWKYILYNPGEDSGAPWFYRLPIFSLNENRTPRMDREAGASSILFSVPRTKEAGEDRALLENTLSEGCL